MEVLQETEVALHLSELMLVVRSCDFRLLRFGSSCSSRLLRITELNRTAPRTTFKIFLNLLSELYDFISSNTVGFGILFASSSLP